MSKDIVITYERILSPKRYGGALFAMTIILLSEFSRADAHCWDQDLVGTVWISEEIKKEDYSLGRCSDDIKIKRVLRIKTHSSSEESGGGYAEDRRFPNFNLNVNHGEIRKTGRIYTSQTHVYGLKDADCGSAVTNYDATLKVNLGGKDSSVAGSDEKYYYYSFKQADTFDTENIQSIDMDDVGLKDNGQCVIDAQKKRLQFRYQDGESLTYTRVE